MIVTGGWSFYGRLFLEPELKDYLCVRGDM